MPAIRDYGPNDQNQEGEDPRGNFHRSLTRFLRVYRLYWSLRLRRGFERPDESITATKERLDEVRTLC